MKWLYEIFRLFKCKHNFIFVKEYSEGIDGKITGYVRVSKCKVCGKEKKVAIP